MKGKKTGGRVKGSLNKATLEIAEVKAKDGILPLDYMLQVMRDPTAEYPRRDDMAKAASPYLHRKMPQAVEHNADIKVEQVEGKVAITEAARAIAFLFAEASRNNS